MLKDKKSFFFLVIILISIDFFDYTQYLKLGIEKNLKFMLIIILFLFSIIKKDKRNKDMFFEKQVMLLMLVPFLSSITCYIYRQQSILTTIIATRECLFFLLYFVLHKLEYKKSQIINVLLFVAIIISFIYIVQQLTYPHLYFGGTIDDAQDIEIRNGFYRFRLFDLNPMVYFSIFYAVDMYFICKSFNYNGKFKYLTFVLLFGITIYLTLTRQIWFCIFIPIIFYKMLTGYEFNFKKIFYLLSSFTILYIIYLNIDVIVGKDLIERSQQEASDENVRALAYNFYGLEFWDGWFNILLGNGIPSWGNSFYGNQMKYIETVTNLYRSDIGVVGVFNVYGIAYIVCLVLFYKRFLSFFKYLPTYLRMLGIASLINLPLACWTDMCPVLMAVMCYLFDIEILNGRKTITFVKRNNVYKTYLHNLIKSVR